AAGDHPVGGELGVARVGELPVLEEAPGIEQELEALPGEELLLLGVLLVVLRRAALLDAGHELLGLLVERHPRADSPTFAGGPPPARRARARAPNVRRGPGWRP